jgi:hypothetical protein
MVFSSPIFLFLFLPVVLTAYLALPGLRLKNFWLLLASLFLQLGRAAFHPAAAGLDDDEFSPRPLG